MAVHGDVTQPTPKPRTNGIRKHLARKDPRTAVKAKPSNNPGTMASLETDGQRDDDLQDVDTDERVIVNMSSNLRALHGEDEKSKIHRSLLSASDDADLRYTLESDSIMETFGLCKCLRGNVFSFEEGRSSFRAWMDEAFYVTGHFLVDATRRSETNNGSNLCPFCKRRKRHQSMGGETPTGQRYKAKKPLCRNPESGEGGFRYQSDIGMYIKDYRKCRNVCNDNAAPVLGKDVPDPYLQRIRSFSDVIERLELLTTSKSPSINITQPKPKRTPSAPSIADNPSNHTGYQTPEQQQLSRLDTINLAPLAGRPKHLHTTMKELIYQTKRRRRQTNANKEKELTGSIRYDNNDKMQTGNKRFTQMTNERIFCNHVASTVVAKKPHPNTGLMKCKKFTSSTHYLDLSSPRMSFPLPVHVALGVGDGARDRVPLGRSLYVPRCRSASSPMILQCQKPNSTPSTSSGFWSSDGSSACSTSGSSSKPIQKRLFRSNTINDVSGYEHRHKTKPVIYVKSSGYLSTANNKIRSTDVTTGELLVACLLEQEEHLQ